MCLWCVIDVIFFCLSRCKLQKNSTFLLVLPANIYVFCRRDFCVPIFKIFLDIIIVSIYCLKFLSGKNWSYCMKGDLVEIISASGTPIVVTFFLEWKSFLISDFSNSWKLSKRNSIDTFIFYLVLKLVNSIFEIIVGYVCRLVAAICSSIYCSFVKSNSLVAIKHRFLYFFSDFSGRCFTIASQHW